MSNINEHDMTKKMIETLNGGVNKVTPSTNSEKNIISYDSDKQMLNRIREEALYGKGKDVIELSDSELKEEHDKFRENISPRVDFTVFNVYPEQKNVIFGGKFQILDGMEFQLSLEDSDGLYITANNMKLNDEAIKIISSLNAFYVNWSKEWAEKLAKEYKV